MSKHFLACRACQACLLGRCCSAVLGGFAVWWQLHWVRRMPVCAKQAGLAVIARPAVALRRDWCTAKQPVKGRPLKCRLCGGTLILNANVLKVRGLPDSALGCGIMVKRPLCSLRGALWSSLS